MEKKGNKLEKNTIKRRKRRKEQEWKILEGKTE